MYFRLNPECFYIDGKKCGAIYDLIDGDVYALDINESSLIKQCENNEIIDKNDVFLRHLKTLCLGNFYKDRVYIEKIRYGSSMDKYNMGTAPVLRTVFLEITNECHQSCWYCGYNGIKRWRGCIGCNRWNEKGEELSVLKWKSVINDLKDLDCQSIIITGGDILLNWEKTLEIYNYANQSINKVLMVINNKNISEQFSFDMIKNNQLLIQTDNPADITSNNNYILLVDQKNGFSNPEYNKDNVCIDYVSEDFSKTILRSSNTNEQKIHETDIHTFSHNSQYHPCLGNSLAISWKGDVYLCPILRTQLIGNIRNINLSPFLKKNGPVVNKLWTMNLNSIQKCRICEFKYACSDCRALEEAVSGDLHGKSLCAYIPEEGIWLQ